MRQRLLHKLTNTGIGLAIASTLFQNGATKVYLLGRRLNVLQDAIHKLESSPSAPQNSSSVLAAIACDVTDLDSVKAAVAPDKQRRRDRPKERPRNTHSRDNRTVA
jgi:NADP-dependent 3-hydroxy acid dehydrogenase YdfG